MREQLLAVRAECDRRQTVEKSIKDQFVLFSETVKRLGDLEKKLEEIEMNNRLLREALVGLSSRLPGGVDADSRAVAVAKGKRARASDDK